jgi:hypothetical protein
MTPGHWVTGSLPLETKTCPHLQCQNGQEGVMALEDMVITLFRQVARRLPSQGGDFISQENEIGICLLSLKGYLAFKNAYLHL